jgi:hypothetical protein
MQLKTFSAPLAYTASLTTGTKRLEHFRILAMCNTKPAGGTRPISLG